MPPGLWSSNLMILIKFKDNFNQIEFYLFLALVIRCARDELARAIPCANLPTTTLEMYPRMNIREWLKKMKRSKKNQFWVGSPRHLKWILKLLLEKG